MTSAASPRTPAGSFIAGHVSPCDEHVPVRVGTPSTDEPTSAAPTTGEPMSSWGDAPWRLSSSSIRSFDPVFIQ